MHRSDCRPVRRYGKTRERVQHDIEAQHVNRRGGVRRGLRSICRSGEQQLWRRAKLRTGALREWARERRGACNVGEDGCLVVPMWMFSIRRSARGKRYAEVQRLFGWVGKEERGALDAMHYAVFVKKR